MTIIRSLDDLNHYREAALKKKAGEAHPGHTKIVVGLGSCSIAAGALETMQAIQQQVESENMHNVTVTKTGCSGLCRLEPTVQVFTGSKLEATYGRVTPAVARRILKEHVQEGQVVEEFIIT